MKEVLRTASKNISTPIMEVPFLHHVTKSQAEALRIKLSEVSMGKVSVLVVSPALRIPMDACTLTSLIRIIQEILP